VNARPLPNVITGFALIGASVLVGVFSYLEFNAPTDRGAISVMPIADPSPSNLVSVITARQPIKRSQRITAELLSEMHVVAPPPPGAIRDRTDIVDAVALYDISQGQVITEGALLTDENARPGLSVLVPDGLRAVALRVDDEVSVGDFVRPNDRVDIQLVLPSDRVARARGEDVRQGDNTESSVLLQNVLILSTGDTLASPEGQNAAPMKNITVAVRPEDALLLAIAKETGKYSLALRNPTDEQVVKAKRMRVDDLLAHAPQPGAVRPPIPKAKPMASRSKAQNWSITIVRGADSSVEKFVLDDGS
jgi:pilus assembly protein CpaB